MCISYGFISIIPSDIPVIEPKKPEASEIANLPVPLIVKEPVASSNSPVPFVISPSPSKLKDGSVSISIEVH